MKENLQRNRRDFVREKQTTRMTVKKRTNFLRKSEGKCKISVHEQLFVIFVDWQTDGATFETAQFFGLSKSRPSEFSSHRPTV
jgi:hypothetical protein